MRNVPTTKWQIYPTWLLVCLTYTEKKRTLYSQFYAVRSNDQIELVLCENFNVNANAFLYSVVCLLFRLNTKCVMNSKTAAATESN